MRERGGGRRDSCPLLPFARRGIKGGRSALWNIIIKYYLINHISSDAFWAKSWGVILNVTWLSMFAFIGKSTHNCRFISSPESIEVPFGVRLPPPPIAFLLFWHPWLWICLGVACRYELLVFCGKGLRSTWMSCRVLDLHSTTEVVSNSLHATVLDKSWVV